MVTDARGGTGRFGGGMTVEESPKPRRAGRVVRRVLLAFGLVVALFAGWVYFSVNPGGDPPDPAGLGADPKLAPADEQLIPTVHSANVIGWPADKAPRVADGTPA